MIHELRIKEEKTPSQFVQSLTAGNHGKFHPFMVITLIESMVVGKLGQFSNSSGKNWGQGEGKFDRILKVKEYIIPALTDHSFLENLGKNKVFSFSCKNKPQDPINDGVRNGTGHLHVAWKIVFWLADMGKGKELCFSIEL